MAETWRSQTYNNAVMQIVALDDSIEALFLRYSVRLPPGVPFRDQMYRKIVAN